MKSTTILAFAVASLFACFLPSSAHAAQTFKLDDLRKLVALSDARISPDGKRVAVVVSTPAWKSDKNRTQIDLIDIATDARRTLTWHRDDISSPRWSPDGTRLAFTAKDSMPKPEADASADAGAGANPTDNDKAADEQPDKLQAQIFIMPMNGGDPVRVTIAKRGVDSFSWSPDGTRIAYISQDPPINEKEVKAHNQGAQRCVRGDAKSFPDPRRAQSLASVGDFRPWRHGQAADRARFQPANRST